METSVLILVWKLQSWTLGIGMETSVLVLVLEYWMVLYCRKYCGLGLVNTKTYCEIESCVQL